MGGRAVRCGVCVCATATKDRSQGTIGFVLLTTKALSKEKRLLRQGCFLDTLPLRSFGRPADRVATAWLLALVVMSPSPASRLVLAILFLSAIVAPSAAFNVPCLAPRCFEMYAIGADYYKSKFPRMSLIEEMVV